MALPHVLALALPWTPTSWFDVADAPTTPHDLSSYESLLLGLKAGVGVVAAVLVAIVIHVVIRRLARRSPLVMDLSRRSRKPLRALLVVLVMRQVALDSLGTDAWLGGLRFLLTLALIGTGGWLVATMGFVVEDVILRKYRVDVADNGHARRVRTQVGFLRRLLVTLVVVLAVAAMLLTIPSVRQVGAGILASAGLLSVVAGLAAQSALTNVFAGLQLAFTDMLRVDDAVVVETQFGKIEEITMTYVVVKLWDERRMVLPSTYFTTTPFENWTRRDSELLGTVLLDVDWRTDLDAMRAEMRRAVEKDELWDGRVAVLQVVEATGSVMQVRALVSAADAPSTFDLRCHVREALARWLVATDPMGLPRQRVENSGAPEALPAAVRAATAPSTWDLPATPAPLADAAPDRSADSLYTGSTEAVRRRAEFTGPPPEEQALRGHHDDATTAGPVAGRPGRDAVAASPERSAPAPGGPAPGDGPGDDVTPATADQPATAQQPATADRPVPDRRPVDDEQQETARQPAVAAPVDPDATRVLPRIRPKGR